MTGQRADDQTRSVNRAVTILTRSTEALVHATDEYDLLDDICRIGAEVAGYRLTWIGYARPAPGKLVMPIASAGTALDYLDRIEVSWGEGESGDGPTGVAIRSGQPCIVSDTEADPRFAPWRDAAREYGFRSTIALPIGEGEARIGALMFYSEQPNAFDPLTVRLLTGIAGNLAHGISALRMKARHDQTARELAESEERYRSLIEMAPDAILVHSHGTILFANPASSEVFGAGPDVTLVGRPLLDMVHDESRTMAISRIAEPPPGPYLGQYKLVGLDGRIFDAEVTACAITFRGMAARLLTIRDITERTQAQDQMLQTAKLATLGEMAAGLVHELSQPLNIIRLASEGALMLIERGKATAEWQAQQFQLVAEQSERAAEIIDDIRIFSRRDATPLQVFDAMDSVKSAIDVLSGQLKPDGITIELTPPHRASPVRGRRVQLEQVVMNLLNNAHHALKDVKGGMPRDWNGKISVSARHDSNQLLIRIVDNGPGIPDAIRARIFEPFFTTKEAGRGTGLGLSVSFTLIATMGGHLQALASDSGAAFVIQLPLAHEMQPFPASLPPCAPSHGAFGNAHVLVVDDETAAAESLGHYLKALGCRVSVAGTGEEAWSLFSSDPADVVITDLRMPAGNGEELVEKLRDFDPLQPIIIVTGHLGATERIADSLQDDRCAVLKKPLALGTLGEIIAEFLQPPAE
ncbi:hybrid sensor histidine kinase/response regulator [Paramagnetospirillum kuznetsovii]|uniref:histidine kinase n=1 Tax=Paramagnetospirillum kuznetsovii TaxID=2053833 RepID=A0A364NVT7_9PROT|nr:ATP-binding protein [Paramagnetospirillum kuznetsovii]RAU21204.1 hybrid sensor histidine kinase/response regulator [Paramagnetospirillum kuznetsovii]